MSFLKMEDEAILDNRIVDFMIGQFKPVFLENLKLAIILDSFVNAKGLTIIKKTKWDT